jgi:hypothetical protein
MYWYSLILVHYQLSISPIFFVYFDSILRCWAKYIALAAPSIIPDALSIQYNAYNQFFNMYPAHENLYAGGLKLFLFRVCCLLFFLFFFIVQFCLFPSSRSHFSRGACCNLYRLHRFSEFLIWQPDWILQSCSP